MVSLYFDAMCDSSEQKIMTPTSIIVTKINLLKHFDKIRLHSGKKLSRDQTGIRDFRLILCEETKRLISSILTVYNNIFLHAIWINYSFSGSALKTSACCAREKWAQLSLPSAEAIIHCIYSTASSSASHCSVLHDLLLVHNVWGSPLLVVAMWPCQEVWAALGVWG